MSQTWSETIFSRVTETKGRMKRALRRVSKTLFNISNSATMVLPALVGAEYTRLPPPVDIKTNNKMFYSLQTIEGKVDGRLADCVITYKVGTDHTVQNWNRSNLDGLVRVWPNASGLEASRCARIIRTSFWHEATSSLPVSHFQTQLHSSTDGPDHVVQNQPRLILFWLSASGFGQVDPVWEQGSMQESSGLLLANVSKPIRIRCKSISTCLLSQC